jgi:soluble lytic murein transglycosylase
VVAGIVLLTMPLAKRAVNDAFGLPLRYAATIRQQAAAKHLDPALVAAVIYAETKFEPRISSAGAVGLMQVEPQTALYLAHRSGATTFTTSDLRTPSVNIAYGSGQRRHLGANRRDPRSPPAARRHPVPRDARLRRQGPPRPA